jgi:hypothetical protein
LHVPSNTTQSYNNFINTAPKMSMSIEECQTPRPGFPKPVPNTPSNVMQQFSMEGKVIVVTGAAEGIGGAVADAMAEAGGNVALWYNSNSAAVKRAESLAQEHSVKTKAYSVNVTPPWNPRSNKSSKTSAKSTSSSRMPELATLSLYSTNLSIPTATSWPPTSTVSCFQRNTQAKYSNPRASAISSSHPPSQRTLSMFQSISRYTTAQKHLSVI